MPPAEQSQMAQQVQQVGIKDEQGVWTARDSATLQKFGSECRIFQEAGRVGNKVAFSQCKK